MQKLRLLLVSKGKPLLLKGRVQLRRYIAWKHSWKTSTAGLMTLFVAVLLGWNVLHSSAAVSTMVPDGDTTAAWTTGGTTDSTCAGGTHCDFVDEGATDDQNTYVQVTNANTSTGVTDQFTLNSPSAVLTASQIVVRIWMNGTAASNGTMNTISLNLIVSGVAQTATTCTPTTGWTACTATYSGSWNQTAVDSMQVSIVRNTTGSGNAASKAGTVKVANVYGTLTYTPNQSFTQSSYRWFSNQDTSAPMTFASALGASSVDQGYSVKPTSDGGYIATGTSFGSSYDMVLTKYSAAGDITWSKKWGGTGTEQGFAVVPAVDGGYAVTGRVSSFGAGGDDMFLAKYDSTGTLSWSKTWGGTGTDQGNSLVQTSDGGYVVTGQTNGSGIGAGLTDMFIAKYNSTGTLSWSKAWGGTASDKGNAVIQTSDGGYAVAGDSTSVGSGGGDAVLVKYDSTGTLSWSKTWGDDSGFDTAVGIVQTGDGGYALTGGTGNLGAGGGDMFITKYDSTGTLSWSKTLGGTGIDIGRSLAQTADGGYAVVGDGYTYATGVSDIYIAKYDSSGVIAGCASTICRADTVGGGSDYTSVRKADTVGGGSDYTSTRRADTVGGGSDYTSVRKADTVGGGSDYTSVRKADTVGGGSDYTSTSAAFVGTTTGIATLSPTGIDVGSALNSVAQDTPTTAPNEGTVYRLRLNIHVTGSQLDTNTGAFKLRYGLKGGGACSAATYSDVTDSSTGIRYADNANAASGLGLLNATSPTHSGDASGPVGQTYQENGTTTFTNPTAVPAGQDGMWDFGLVSYHAIGGDTYCFKVTDSANTDISSYTTRPEITIPAASFSQAAYRWYNPEPNGAGATFVKDYDGIPYTYAKSITVLADGGYAVTGETNYDGFQDSGGDFFVMRLSSSGAVLWAKYWGDDIVPDSGVSVIQNSNGNIVVLGNSTSALGTGMFISEYNLSNGSVLWTKLSGSAFGGNAIIQTSDGGYAVTGTVSTGFGDTNAFIAKLSSAGVPTWSRNYGLTDGAGTGNKSDGGASIIEDSNGKFVITGFTQGYGNGQDDMFIARYTSTGTLDFSRTLGTVQYEEGSSVAQTSDGGYVVAGFSNAYSGNSLPDMFYAKYDSTGAQTDVKTWGGTGTDYGFGVVATSDGGFAISGSTNSYGNGSYDTFLAKYSVAAGVGTLTYSKTVGGTGYDDGGTAIALAADGGFAVAMDDVGLVGNSVDHAMVARFDSSGSISGCPATVCKSYTVTSSTQSFTSPTQSDSNSSAALTTGTNSMSPATLSVTATNVVGVAATIGSPFAPTNKPLDLTTLTPVSLRIAIAMNNSGIAASGQSFKLKYAVLGSATSCTSIANGSYADITTSTPVQFYDDTRHSSGEGIASDSTDPADGTREMVVQSYQEANSFTNNMSALYAGQDGIWQFSLAISSSLLKGKDVCLKVTKADDSFLTAYSNIAEVSYAPQMTQLMKGGKWFNRAGVKQNLIL